MLSAILLLAGTSAALFMCPFCQKLVSGIAAPFLCVLCRWVLPRRVSAFLHRLADGFTEIGTQGRGVAGLIQLLQIGLGGLIHAKIGWVYTPCPTLASELREHLAVTPSAVGQLGRTINSKASSRFKKQPLRNTTVPNDASPSTTKPCVNAVLEKCVESLQDRPTRVEATRVEATRVEDVEDAPAAYTMHHDITLSWSFQQAETAQAETAQAETAQAETAQAETAQNTDEFIGIRSCSPVVESLHED